LIGFGWFKILWILYSNINNYILFKQGCIDGGNTTTKKSKLVEFI